MPESDLPDPEQRIVRFHSPEARREEALEQGELGEQGTPARRKINLPRRVIQVTKRVAVGAYNDGFIHAGNLAYMSMLAIFPFFITGAAIFSAIGEESERAATVNAVLYALPPVVADVIGPVARNVIEARNGWLLWVGGLIGLWTVGSLIETIRDILRRAYGTEATYSFWTYRLLSSGIIIAAVVLLMTSLILQFLIGAAQEVIEAYIPQFTNAMSELSLSRLVSGLGLFGSMYLLFYTLTPSAYRHRRYPKWPGALAVTAWWIGVTLLLPKVLSNLFSYDLTYGSLAGMMIALFFFWLVGLGVVVGAELNAALAETPEEEDLAGQADNRTRENRGKAEEGTSS
ncbi:YihY/virulence factor BrkB family protein [Altererythrobacter sp. ZODW24]|uniref:YihY/virulence factor BrkB family protein n=1 Tax=Altererythrobacter sp. ZODW24 TaxID=2185142 RepID=UPI000DF7241F|nr:YihY/virulence factor BrkB family protein [Altererythrobacter sp. ZODW24]